jgi:hypothetical protein
MALPSYCTSLLHLFHDNMLASRVLEDPNKQNFTLFLGPAKTKPRTLVHKLYNEFG